MSPFDSGVLKKSGFFNTPAESAGGRDTADSARELRFLLLFCSIFAEKRAKTSRPRDEQFLDGSLKNREASFLTASYWLNATRN